MKQGQQCSPVFKHKKSLLQTKGPSIIQVKLSVVCIIAYELSRVDKKPHVFVKRMRDSAVFSWCSIWPIEVEQKNMKKTKHCLSHQSQSKQRQAKNRTETDQTKAKGKEDRKFFRLADRAGGCCDVVLTNLHRLLRNSQRQASSDWDT